MSKAPKTELLKGKGGTHYPPFPVLGLASDAQDIFMMCGGGGSSAAKEVPNMVQAYHCDEASGQLTAVAHLSTVKEVVVGLTYSAARNQWLGTCSAGCKVLALDAASRSIMQICEWTTEFESKPRDPACQNLARYSPGGDIIATGGTDGIVRFYSPASVGVPPALLRQSAQHKEVSDLDFSADGALLASVDKTGCCRLWDPSSATEKISITYEAGGKGKLDIRFVRFAPSPGGDILVIGAAGSRGPAYLAMYTTGGQKLGDVCIDPKTSLTCLGVDAGGTMACVCLATGGKKVYSLPSLRLLQRVENVHELPAPCCAFLGSTAISGSADRAIHVMTVKVSGGGGSVVYKLACFWALLVLIYLLLHLGVKGAALSQAGKLEL